MSPAMKRDHGGGLDAAVAQYGGTRADWLDLSTGINPEPYPIPVLDGDVWTALPDLGASQRLEQAARAFWKVPEGAGVLAVPGASAAIAHIPLLMPAGRVRITGPTYNEHAASFAAAGWDVVTEGDDVAASVHVHPNNPDGRLVETNALHGSLRIIDESFCDVMPEASLISATGENGMIVLKSFGKFWGLAGLRLGFVIAKPALTQRLAEMLGPWPVSGPALTIGAQALNDTAWADTTRQRLTQSAGRLDEMMTGAGARIVGGTSLFRLYEVDDAVAWQSRLATHHIWSRIFPYSKTWLRLGLPPQSGWQRLQTALA